MRVDNTAEGGAAAGGAGTAVTVANSDAASGTAWTSVTAGTGVSVRYDNAQAAHGGWSIRHATGATSAQGLLFWDASVLGARARLWVRLYVRLSSVATARDLIRVRSGSTQALRVRMAAGGQIELRNGANTVVATTGGTTLAANTWYRIEVDARPGTSVANSVRIYEGDATSLFTSITATDNYSGAATVDEVTFGNAAAAANLPDAWFDDMAATDVDWIGPPSTGVVVDGDTAVEASTADAGTGGKNAAGVAAGESSTTAAGTGAKTRAGGAAAEASTAAAGAGAKTTAGVAAGESSTTATGAGAKNAAGVAAAQSNTAAAGAGGKTRAGSAAADTSSAATGAGAKTRAGTAVVEASTAAAGEGAATYAGSTAVEVDAAQAGTPTPDTPRPPAVEVSTAHAGVGAKTRTGAAVGQTDTAAAGTGRKARTGAAGVESSTAHAGSGAKTTAGEQPAVEVDAAHGATVVTAGRPVSPAYARSSTTTAAARTAASSGAARRGTTTAGVRIR